MTDLNMQVLVSRTLLGLDVLDVNDHENYYVSGQNFLSGNVQWNRVQVTSPFLDGAYTVHRTQQQVTEPLTIEVMGDTQVILQNNIAALRDAFTQDSYQLHVILSGSAHYRYRCESADFQIQWNGPRFISRQVQMVFSVPRQPRPLLGV